MRPDDFRDITGESARSSSESDAIAFPQIGAPHRSTGVSRSGGRTYLSTYCMADAGLHEHIDGRVDVDVRRWRPDADDERVARPRLRALEREAFAPPTDDGEYGQMLASGEVGSRPLPAIVMQRALAPKIGL